MTEIDRINTLKNNLPVGSAVYLTSPSARRYFSNFSADDAAVLITADGAYFFTDSRYVEAAKKNITSMEVLTPRSYSDELIEKAHADTVFCDISHTDANAFFKLESKLKENGITLSRDNTADKIISDMRSVKDETEVGAIKSAQKLTDDTFLYILERIEAGRTEKEIMLDMEYYSRKSGSEEVAFDFIVVSGKNSSLPHGVPTDKKIERGDFITMDFGCTVNGYRSDMTRTVAVGYVCDEQKKVYETVLKAQTEALKSIKSGVAAKDIDKIARDIITDAGYGDYFGHAFGHGVGLDIHEQPNLSPKSEKILKAGNVVTAEPGIYIPNSFGVRIEDMVLVTDNAYQNFTKSNKNLIIL